MIPKAYLKKREELFFKIKDNCTAYGIGLVDNIVIDKVNILEATKIAMGMLSESLAKDAALNIYFRCFNLGRYADSSDTYNKRR